MRKYRFNLFRNIEKADFAVSKQEDCLLVSSVYGSGIKSAAVYRLSANIYAAKCVVIRLKKRELTQRSQIKLAYGRLISFGIGQSILNRDSHIGKP